MPVTVYIRLTLDVSFKNVNSNVGLQETTNCCYLSFSKGSDSAAVWPYRLFLVFIGVVLHGQEACECQRCNLIYETSIIV